MSLRRVLWKHLNSPRTPRPPQTSSLVLVANIPLFFGIWSIALSVDVLQPLASSHFWITQRARGVCTLQRLGRADARNNVCLCNPPHGGYPATGGTAHPGMHAPSRQHMELHVCSLCWHGRKIPCAAQVMVTCITLLSTKSTATAHFRSCLSRLAQMVGWVSQINTCCKNEHQMFTKMNTICSFPYQLFKNVRKENIPFWGLWEWEIFEGGNRPFAGRIREIRQFFSGFYRAED